MSETCKKILYLEAYSEGIPERFSQQIPGEECENGQMGKAPTGNT